MRAAFCLPAGSEETSLALGRRMEASRHLRAPTLVQLGDQPPSMPACEDEPTACVTGARGTCERAMWQFYKGWVRGAQSRSSHPLNSKRVQSSGPKPYDACEPRERNGGKQPLGQERALPLSARAATSERLEEPPVPAGHCKVGGRHGLCGRITPRCTHVCGRPARIPSTWGSPAAPRPPPRGVRGALTRSPSLLAR